MEQITAISKTNDDVSVFPGSPIKAGRRTSKQRQLKAAELGSRQHNSYNIYAEHAAALNGTLLVHAFGAICVVHGIPRDLRGNRKNEVLGRLNPRSRCRNPQFGI